MNQSSDYTRDKKCREVGNELREEEKRQIKKILDEVEEDGREKALRADPESMFLASVFEI